MCLKIRCDGESEKFCKIFWELNKAYKAISIPELTHSRQPCMHDLTYTWALQPRSPPWPYHAQIPFTVNTEH